MTGTPTTTSAFVGRDLDFMTESLPDRVGPAHGRNRVPRRDLYPYATDVPDSGAESHRRLIFAAAVAPYSGGSAAITIPEPVRPRWSLRMRRTRFLVAA